MLEIENFRNSALSYQWFQSSKSLSQNWNGYDCVSTSLMEVGDNATTRISTQHSASTSGADREAKRENFKNTF